MGPRHWDPASSLKLRRLEGLNRGGGRRDLSACAGHVCIIQNRPPSGIVPWSHSEWDQGTEPVLSSGTTWRTGPAADEFRRHLASLGA